MKTIRFESLGLYLPPNIVSTHDLLNTIEGGSDLQVERITAIKNRRFKSEDENCLSMAVAAAKDCLDHSLYQAGDLDIIINASITRFKDGRHYIEPSFSASLVKELGARKDIIHFDVTNACAGMFTGAFLLYNLIKEGKVKNGMVVSGESFSDVTRTALHEVKDKIDLQFASLTFGDSGAAFIMDGGGDNNENIDMIDFITVAEHADLCVGMPSNENPGMAIYTCGKEIHEENIKRWPYFVDNVLKRNGLDFKTAGFDYIITHQTSVRAIESFLATGENYFGTAMPTALFSVQDFGNTTTTTHFVAFYNCLKEKKIKPNSKVLLVGNASGITISCFVVKAENMISLVTGKGNGQADEAVKEALSPGVG